jgi:hypothetical protein
MPEEDNVGIKITPKGRTVWSQMMLKHLADARKLAIEEVMANTYFGKSLVPRAFGNQVLPLALLTFY